MQGPAFAAAQRPWSPRTHDLFPRPARARAAEAARVGHRLERARWPHLATVFVCHVLPFAVAREPGEALRDDRAAFLALRAGRAPEEGAA